MIMLVMSTRNTWDTRVFTGSDLGRLKPYIQLSMAFVLLDDRT
jgi:hypothetical protein